MLFNFILLMIYASIAGCGGRFLNKNTESQSHPLESPNKINNPLNFGVETKRWDTMIKSADLSKVPWDGYVWATRRAGVAFRWQTDSGMSYRDYLYTPHSVASIRNMPQSQIDALSPAEKYDLYLGREGFDLTRAELDFTLRKVGREGVPDWLGICHGWSPAAIMEPEPGFKTTVQTPFGFSVTFYSHDIRALLSKVYAEAKDESRHIGGRCNKSVVARDKRGRVIAPECRDVNPASLHLVMEDYVARQNKSFVVDILPDDMVWNYPVAGYTFSYSNERSLASQRSYIHAVLGTVKLVDVHTALRYVKESSPSIAIDTPNIQEFNLDYTLEIDSQGMIVGGEWISEIQPDFMWELTRQPTSTATRTVSYSAVKSLLDASLAGGQPRP